MDGPAQIGEWQKISDLGSGAFGVVSLWKNVTTEDYIAIKKCKFHMTTHLTEKQKERWHNEVEIMKVINHPNVIKYKPIPHELEVGILKYNPTKLPLLPMEYCRKGNLRRVLCKPKNFSGLQEEDIRCILADVTNGLLHLHKLKITHRDIKPDNIVLQHCNDRKGNTIYKIIDLGYAKELEDTVVSFVGTLHYLAPEIFQNVQYGASVDYWSMGILTFEVICGVLPFLPHLSPFERFDKIKEKRHDDICIYRSYTGQITYSFEIKKEHFISSCLKQQLEFWLRHVLQYDPKIRSENFTNDVKVFEYMNVILKKNIVNVFSVHKLEFYSYEVNESTLMSTLKDWISRDTNICKTELILLFDNGSIIVSETSLAVDVLKDTEMVFIFKKGILVNENVSYNFPKLLREVFKPKFDNSHIKQLYNQTIYYVTVEKTVVDTFRRGLSLFVIYIQNVCEYLKRCYAETSNNVKLLLKKIECYNNIRKNNTCDIDLSKSCENRDCLIYYQRLLASLERSIGHFKDLGKKIAYVAKKQQIFNEVVPQVKKIIDGSNIGELYQKVLNLVEKDAGNKLTNGKTFISEIKNIVSETIKIKDHLISKKEIKSHLSTIAKLHSAVDDLKTWIVQFNNHLIELSKSFEQSEIVYRNIIEKASETSNKRGAIQPVTSFDGELLNLPSEYLIQENKELRYKFDDVLSKSILDHKNYVASVKTCF